MASLVKESHVEWLNDKRLMRYSEQRHHEHTMETQHTWLNGFPPESYVWLIREDDGGGVYDVGTVTAHIDGPNGTANMGILVGIQGHGYGLAAWRAVMSFLIGKNVRKIECGCMRQNMRMRNLATRSGMTLEAEVPNHFLLDDIPEDLLIYGICP